MYVRKLREDHSNYYWLLDFPNILALSFAREIVDQSEGFGFSNGHKSDSTTHFEKSTLRLVFKDPNVSRSYIIHMFLEVVRLWNASARIYFMSFELLSRNFQWVEPNGMDRSLSYRVSNPSLSQSADVSLITAFMGMKPTPPTSISYRTYIFTYITILEVPWERPPNVDDLIAKIKGILYNPDHSSGQSPPTSQLSLLRLSPQLIKGGYVVMAHKDFTAAKKLSLCWPGRRRVVKTLYDHVNYVKDLQNEPERGAHASHLQLYHD